jgi:predicted ATPase
MVREMLGCAVLPSAFVERMVTTSEGNPLFLTELVRMLADEQVLVRPDGHWEYRDGGGHLSVPPTVHQIVGARLERLNPDERFTLECAAVIGRVFTAAALRALVGPHRAGALEPELRNLEVRELIEPLDPSIESAHEDQEYRFLSEVVRDVAYALLLKQTRAELHEAYSRWLLDDSDDDRHRAAAKWHSRRARSYRQQLGSGRVPAPLGKGQDGSRTALCVRVAPERLNCGDRIGDNPLPHG